MVHTQQTSPRVKLRSAFTLVELIVVITILAILGTIGFLSVNGYSSRARDSERVADVWLISKSLDLSVIASGAYPVPDNAFSVVYSGSVVWYQGTVGNNVIQRLHTSVTGGGIDSRPIDPLKGTEYTYATLAESKAYQIKAEYENDLGQTAIEYPVSTAYAAPGAPTIAYVRWNFGGLVAKTTTGSVVYLLAVPSILTNSGIAAGVSVNAASLSGTLIFNGKSLTGASSFNPGTLAYSLPSLPKDDSGGQATAIANGLKAAYSGSDIVSHSAVATLMGTPAPSMSAFALNILASQLGVATGSNNDGTTSSGSCTGLPVNAIYANNSTSYSVANANTLSAVAAGYRASPTANTCQWSCNGSSIYNSGNWTCQAYVTATETDYNVYYNFWNSQPINTNFYYAIGSNIWEIKKTANMPAPGQSCAYFTNWFSLSARFSTNGGATWNAYTMSDQDGTSHICTNQSSHGWSQYMTYGWGCATNPTRAFGGGIMCDASGNTIGANWTVKLFY